MTIRSQTRAPGTVVSDDTVGTIPWADPEKAEVEDNDPATATGPGTSEYLKATDYDLDIPAAATIVDVAGLPRRRGSGGGQSAWTVIDEVALGAPAASIEFSTGLSGYRLFRLTAYLLKDGTQGQVILRLNNDSGNNYEWQRHTGYGTVVEGQRVTGQPHISLTGASDQMEGQAGTYSVTVGKQVTGSPAMVTAAAALYWGGSVDNIVTMSNVGRWVNAADLITRIDLIASTGNFAAGTVVVLEGVPD